MSKEELRSIAKERRYALTDEYRESASAVIAERVLSSSLFADSSVIFCYVSDRFEPDTLSLIKEALAAGKTVCVPRCYGNGKMDAAELRSLSDLTDDAFHGILQPDRVSAAIDPRKIDLSLVPCLAAGRRGERLGRGAGYYDRFLPLCSGKKACLCFDKMIIEAIPMDHYDVRMDHLFTESEHYVFKNCSNLVDKS